MRDADVKREPNVGAKRVPKNTGAPKKPNPGRANLTIGRAPGVPNKINRSIKDELLSVYHAIGGGESLAKWAMENPGDFYTKLWIKVLPVKLVGDAENPIQFEVVIRPHGTANEALPAIEHGVTVEGAEYEVEP